MLISPWIHPGMTYPYMCHACPRKLHNAAYIFNRRHYSCFDHRLSILSIDVTGAYLSGCHSKTRPLLNSINNTGGSCNDLNRTLSSLS